MESIYDRRAANLRNLIDNLFKGSQTEMSYAVSKPQGLLSLFVNKKKNMGNNIAREIEQELNLPNLWLDMQQTQIDAIGTNIRNAIAQIWPMFHTIDSLASAWETTAFVIALAQDYGIVTRKLITKLEHTAQLLPGSLLIVKNEVDQPRASHLVNTPEDVDNFLAQMLERQIRGMLDGAGYDTEITINGGEITMKAKPRPRELTLLPPVPNPRQTSRRDLIGSDPDDE